MTLVPLLILSRMLWLTSQRLAEKSKWMHSSDKSLPLCKYSLIMPPVLFARSGKFMRKVSVVACISFANRALCDDFPLQ